jgi:hypothetical protein
MCATRAYRTIGVEDHLVTEDVMAAWDHLSDEARADSQPGAPRGGELTERLVEVGERRFTAMDDAGLDVQVLSLTSPALHNLPAAEARRLQTATNDYARPGYQRGLPVIGEHRGIPDAAADGAYASGLAVVQVAPDGHEVTATLVLRRRLA